MFVVCCYLTILFVFRICCFSSQGCLGFGVYDSFKNGSKRNGDSGIKSILVLQTEVKVGRIDKFEDLEVWKLARSICQQVEWLFQNTDLGKNYALRNQMERSSGSIMDNIAEGFGRGGNQEFHNFLSYSKGSTTELKSQLYRAWDKGLIDKTQFDFLAEECALEENRIGAFMHYLRNSDIKGQKFKK